MELSLHCQVCELPQEKREQAGTWEASRDDMGRLLFGAERSQVAARWPFPEKVKLSQDHGVSTSLHQRAGGAASAQNDDPMDLKPLITLLAIVNPLACVPFFIHFTQDFGPGQRRRTVWIASVTVFIVIGVSALLGLQILSFFGISLASFQVGGGMLLLTSALAMLNAQPAEARATAGEMTDAESRSSVGSSIAVVPLAIPLLTGPATMSTVVIYADKARDLLQTLLLVGYGLVIAVATAICLSLAGPIARVLGQTGINVMTRLMGLILAALAVEVMADGLQSLFPLLASRGRN
jgi:multiple antibiotic resistance protein